MTGRVALVTGAGRGIGREAALGFGAAGAHVICAYQTDEKSAQSVVESIRADGSEADAVMLDLADVASIRSAISGLAERGVLIDILVNNAAMRPRTHLEDITVDEWDKVLATNLRGAFFLSQAVLPHMLSRQWGRIVNVSGIDAYRGSVDRVHVTASKLGIVGLSRAMGAEIARQGVTVNTVVPGFIDTERRHPEWSDDLTAMRHQALLDIPMARLGLAAEVANACVFLASEQASYITGQELLVTGGAHPLVRQRARERDFDELRVAEARDRAV